MARRVAPTHLMPAYTTTTRPTTPMAMPAADNASTSTWGAYFAACSRSVVSTEGASRDTTEAMPATTATSGKTARNA